MSHPFRFYGRRPADWRGDAGYRYRVTFQAPPDAAAREMLAQVYARATRHGVLAPSGWRWSGRWAEVVFDARSGAADAGFARAADAFVEMHAAAPIDEVELVAVVERSAPPDAWTAWSLAQQPVPSRSPAGFRAYGGEVDPALPAFAADAAFDQLLARAKTAQEAAAGSALAAQAVSAGELALVPIGPDVWSPPRDPQAAARAREAVAAFATAGAPVWYTRRGATGRVAAALTVGPTARRVVWLAEDGVAIEELPMPPVPADAPWWEVYFFAFTRAGDELLVVLGAGSTRHVGRVALATKAIAWLWRGNDFEWTNAKQTAMVDQKITAVYELAGGALGVCCTNRIALVRAGALLTAAACKEPHTLYTVRDGTVVIAVMPAGVRVWSWTGESLAPIGALKTKVYGFAERDGRIFADGVGQAYELVNYQVPQAPPAKPAKPRAKKTKA